MDFGILPLLEMDGWWMIYDWIRWGSEIMTRMGMRMDMEMEMVCKERDRIGRKECRARQNECVADEKSLETQCNGH